MQLCSTACCVSCLSGDAVDLLTCTTVLRLTDALLCVVKSYLLVCLSVNTQTSLRSDSWWNEFISSSHAGHSLLGKEKPEVRELLPHTLPVLCVHVMLLWLPHLSVICSVRPSSCSPRGMAHMCLTAAPPALLNLSFLSFAVLSLFSSLLSCHVRANKTTTRLVIGPKYNELRDWHHGVSARALNVQ